jgi:hypothetical protein
MPPEVHRLPGKIRLLCHFESKNKRDIHKWGYKNSENHGNQRQIGHPFVVYAASRVGAEADKQPHKQS